MLRVRRRAFARPRLGPGLLSLAGRGRPRGDRGGPPGALRRAPCRALGFARPGVGSATPARGRRLRDRRVLSQVRALRPRSRHAWPNGGRSPRRIWRPPPTAGSSPTRWVTSLHSERGSSRSIPKTCAARRSPPAARPRGKAASTISGEHGSRRIGRGPLRTEHLCGVRHFLDLPAEQEIPPLLQMDAPGHEGTACSWCALPRLLPTCRASRRRGSGHRHHARPTRADHRRHQRPLIADLSAEGLSDSTAISFIDHGYAVQATIENQALRSLPVMME